jgi:hypothetical protein
MKICKFPDTDAMLKDEQNGTRLCRRVNRAKSGGQSPRLIKDREDAEKEAIIGE